MSRCHHGTPIKDSWEECPYCCQEHDSFEATDAAKAAADELKNQTEILRKIEYRQTNQVSGNSKSQLSSTNSNKLTKLNIHEKIKDISNMAKTCVKCGIVIEDGVVKGKNCGSGHFVYL